MPVLRFNQGYLRTIRAIFQASSGAGDSSGAMNVRASCVRARDVSSIAVSATLLGENKTPNSQRAPDSKTAHTRIQFLPIPASSQRTVPHTPGLCLNQTQPWQQPTPSAV